MNTVAKIKIFNDQFILGIGKRLILCICGDAEPVNSVLPVARLPEDLFMNNIDLVSVVFGVPKKRARQWMEQKAVKTYDAE